MRTYCNKEGETPACLSSGKSASPALSGTTNISRLTFSDEENNDKAKVSMQIEYKVRQN